MRDEFERRRREREDLIEFEGVLVVISEVTVRGEEAHGPVSMRVVVCLVHDNDVPTRALQATVPQVMRHLEATVVGLGLDRVYRQIPAVDLSRDVLAAQPDRLLVLRDVASGWADFGSPSRVVDTLLRDGIEPAWLAKLRNGSRSSNGQSLRELKHGCLCRYKAGGGSA